MAERKEVQEFHGENNEIQCNYIFECEEHLSKKGDSFLKVYKEFIDYKVRSCIDSELPCPSEDAQKDYECVNPMFGKDKLNAPHSSLSQEHSGEQIKLNIHHLHTFDGSRPYNKWQVNKQWLNVSNTFVIYSFVKLNNIFYFYVLDLVMDVINGETPSGGHEALYHYNTIQVWINQAKRFEGMLA